MSTPSNSPSRVSCPSCGGRLKIPAGGTGGFHCPRCGAPIPASAGPTEDRPPAIFSADDGMFAGEANVSVPPPLPDSRPHPESDSSPSPHGVTAEAARHPPAEAAEPIVVEAPHSREPVAGAAEPSADQEFGVSCPLCGTFQYMKRDQIGSSVRCVDCYTPILVRAPKPRKHPPVEPAAEPSDADDGYRLSEPVERAQFDQLHERILSAAEQQDAVEHAASEKSAHRPVGDVIARRAREILERAQLESDAVAEEAAQRVAKPLFQGLFSFLWDVNALPRWAALTALSLVAMLLFHQIVELSRAGGTMQFGALFLTLLLAPLLPIYLTVASACCLAVIQDTANGFEIVEQWPGLNFLDWILDTFYIINSLFASAFPGVLLGLVPWWLGLTSRLPSLLLGLLSGLFLFPLMLLSALDAGSPASLWSPTVFRILRRDHPRARRFYLASAGLFIGGAVSMLVLLARSPFFVSLACAVALNATLLVYARLLGRLAGLLSEESVEIETQDSGDSSAD